MMRIYELLHLLPRPVIESFVALVQAVLASPDPQRTARRYAVMIAARTASEEALRRGKP